MRQHSLCVFIRPRADIETLRATLNSGGYNGVKIIVADSSFSVANDVLAHPDFAQAVWGLGAHCEADTEARRGPPPLSTTRPLLLLLLQTRTCAPALRLSRRASSSGRARRTRRTRTPSAPRAGRASSTRTSSAATWCGRSGGRGREAKPSVSRLYRALPYPRSQSTSFPEKLPVSLALGCSALHTAPLTHPRSRVDQLEPPLGVHERRVTPPPA